MVRAVVTYRERAKRGKASNGVVFALEHGCTARDENRNGLDRKRYPWGGREDLYMSGSWTYFALRLYTSWGCRCALLGPEDDELNCRGLTCSTPGSTTV